MSPVLRKVKEKIRLFYLNLVALFQRAYLVDPLVETSGLDKPHQDVKVGLIDGVILEYHSCFFGDWTFLKFLKLLATWFTVIVKQIEWNFIYFNKFQDWMYFMWCIISALFAWIPFTYLVLWHHSKKRNHLTANSIVVDHSTEGCFESNMKLWVPKKVVLFIFNLILTFSIKIYINDKMTLFQNEDYLKSL